MYSIVLEKQVQKFLIKQKWQPIISQFKNALMKLQLDPYDNALDIKVVVWLPHTYRLRIGKYRFLYEIIDEKIVIVFFKAGSRGDVYNDL